MTSSTLRRRLGKGTDSDADDKSKPRSLQRTDSWHAKAADHVLSRRRYFLLAGVLLGIAGFALLNSVNKEMPDMTDMIQLPAESMKMIRDKFKLEWNKRVNDDFLASIDYRPLLSGSPDRPGLELKAENVTGVSPVVMIPGFTSTGLEIWQGGECSKAYFRQRMWGTARMVQQFVLNQKCWLEHMMLNRTTGLDPDGVKLRPASGLEAADYVIGGYWVWGKIIENLADIGYDSNSMYMAPYDWRLTPSLMEVRDKYFTKLKYMIEMAKATNDGRKVVVISHSYATQVIYFFMQWVESEKGGKGGKDWVDQHIDSFVSVAGSILGTVKSVSALMSGEMKDTAELGGLSRFLEYFFGPPARASLARSWPSVFTMLPIGGEAIWGNQESAPDDFASRFASPQENADGDQIVFNSSLIPQHIEQHGSNGVVLQFVNGTHANLTSTSIRKLLGSMDAGLAQYGALFAEDRPADPATFDHDHPRYWTNPLATALPNAPNMKIFCFYGVGKPVERGYVYRANDPEDDVLNDEGKSTVPFVLNTDYDDLPWVKAGIRYTDGDGTVPLISLGYMCARGWRSKTYNPSGMEIRTREYKHDPVSLIYDPRGGPATSDHVDIMGNHEMIKDILRVAARDYDNVHERINSNIEELSARVNLDLA
ncbi:hypothetical protein Poli38472_004788 [Pythium oligandrum]|uniref:Phospholipid:diacylglycerol acyltransferase n=1 Tax=Pythium oligandrum TaxID=41045 RepID=A0A8K1CAY8_PYTOL|nr:hypothetical protein Poli38472_004788 [Pythium oligandrum]|eukprot:TMW59719.1 hypothetical protein Poli38472_004788 [Pythium oligandrum]